MTRQTCLKWAHSCTFCFTSTATFCAMKTALLKWLLCICILLHKHKPMKSHLFLNLLHWLSNCSQCWAISYPCYDAHILSTSQQTRTPYHYYMKKNITHCWSSPPYRWRDVICTQAWSTIWLAVKVITIVFTKLK